MWKESRHIFRKKKAMAKKFLVYGVWCLWFFFGSMIPWVSSQEENVCSAYSSGDADDFWSDFVLFLFFKIISNLCICLLGILLDDARYVQVWILVGIVCLLCNVFRELQRDRLSNPIPVLRGHFFRTAVLVSFEFEHLYSFFYHFHRDS